MSKKNFLYHFSIPLLQITLVSNLLIPPFQITLVPHLSRLLQYPTFLDYNLVPHLSRILQYPPFQITLVPPPFQNTLVPTFLDYFSTPTFLYVLVAIKGDDGVVVADASKGVDQMGTEVGVDVPRGELGVTSSMISSKI